MSTGKVIFKRVFGMTLGLAVMLSCFSANISGMRTVFAEEEMTEDQTEEEGMTEEMILQGAEELFDQLLKYAGSDSDKFAELFVGASEEEIQAEEEVFAEIGEQEYENQYFGIVVNGEPYFRMTYAFYTLTDDSDDFISKTANEFEMSFTDGQWRKDYSEEAHDAVHSAEQWEAVYPDGMVKALDRGEPNRWTSGDGFCFLDEDFIFDGALDAELLYLWQNEDGSADAVVGMANGTEESACIEEVSITVTNTESGKTILDYTAACNEQIEPGCNETVTFHINASQVLAGTDSWSETGDMSDVYAYTYFIYE